MRLLKPALIAFLVIAPVSLAAHAQYTVGSIAYKGGAPYTDAELTSVAGLQPKQMMSSEALGNAAQHLLDTGLFDDVQVSRTVQGKVLNITFEIKTTPLAKLPAVSLENFVWFTPEELTAGLHQQLPLYRGVSSDAGSFSDSIQTALEQMLTTKGVQARLSHAIIEPTNQQPIRVVNFRVDSPAVRISKIDLIGPVPATLQPDVTKAITAATGRPFDEGLAGFTLEDRLLAPARNGGYAVARLKDVHRSVAASASGVDVTVSATLDAGLPYTASAITLSPGPLYTAADLTRDTQLHPGDFASALQLARTKLPLQAAYLRQGYLDAYVTATPTFDETAHTVAYTLQAVPGEIYHLKSVTATGLDPAAQKAFDGVCTMKVGDLYDATYMPAFLKKNAAREPFQPYSASYRAVGDPQTHLVDLTITFVRSH